MLRRVTSLFQAQVVSDDISWEIRPYNRTDQTTMEGRALDEVVRKVYDAQNVKTLSRKVLRNGVVDGDMCMFFTWDPDIESGQMVKGDIRAEPVMNTNVYFGNPHTQDVQRQPYIIIARRRPLGVVKAEAKAAKVQDWDSIEPDSATEYVGGEEQSEYDQVTELTRFWKVKETIQQDEFSRRSPARASILSEWPGKSLPCRTPKRKWSFTRLRGPAGLSATTTCTASARSRK